MIKTELEARIIQVLIYGVASAKDVCRMLKDRGHDHSDDYIYKQLRELSDRGLLVCEHCNKSRTKRGNRAYYSVTPLAIGESKMFIDQMIREVKLNGIITTTTTTDQLPLSHYIPNITLMDYVSKKRVDVKNTPMS